MKTLALVLVFLSSSAQAISLDYRVQRAYLNAGGSEKALSHLKCFLHNYGDASFSLRPASLSERCNNMAGSQRRIDINNIEHVVIVDYTLPSTQRRLFILDLKRLSRPFVETYFVSHGRYEAPYDNEVLGINRNTVRDARYFSNVSGSNASSSGFFITGHKYQGRWVGPGGDKYSLIVHGISKSRNDRACDRAIVLHGNGWVKETGESSGVGIMSDGCFMVDYNRVNSIIAKIRGGGGTHHPNEARVGGSLFFTYGPSELRLPSNHYCSPKSAETLRL